MRQVIGHEGVVTEDGRYIIPGALHFPRDPVPLKNAQGHIIGTVRDIRREGNDITAEIHLIETEGTPVFELDRVSTQPSTPEQCIIDSGRITQVTVTKDPAWKDLS